MRGYWDSLSRCEITHVCLGAQLNDVSLRVMALGPQGQGRLAREVTVELLPMGQVC
jgi:hypothetical protein